MSLETMTKLATYTVGAGGDSSVTFSNIPQTYTDLVIRVSARTTRSASTLNILYVTFNGVTTNQTARVVELCVSAHTGYTLCAHVNQDTRVWSNKRIERIRLDHLTGILEIQDQGVDQPSNLTKRH